MVDADGDPVWASVPNVMDASGTMYGDIGIPDGYPIKEFVKGQENDQGTHSQQSVAPSYGASLTGDWSTSGLTYTWYDSLTKTTAWGIYGEGYNLSTNGGERVNTPGVGIANFPVVYQGAAVNNDGSVALPGDTNSLSHIHITITDGYGSDGAIKTANYYMNIHRQYVVLSSNRKSIIPGAGPDDGQQFVYISGLFTSCWPSSTYEGDSNGGCNVTYGSPQVDYGIATQAMLVGLTVANIADLGVSATALTIATAVGIPTSELLPRPVTTVISFDSCFGQDTNRYTNPPGSTYEPFGTSQPQPWNPIFADEKQHYIMVPHVVTAYEPKWYLVDVYGENDGFEREDKFPMFTLANRYFWGTFVWVPNPAAYPQSG